jgi:hypothetical protein
MIYLLTYLLTVSSQHTMLSYAWPLTTIINQHTLTHATTLSNRLITITATTTTNTLHTLRAARRHTAIIQEPTWTRYTFQHPRSTIKLEIGSWQPPPTCYPSDRTTRHSTLYTPDTNPDTDTDLTQHHLLSVTSARAVLVDCCMCCVVFLYEHIPPLT